MASKQELMFYEHEVFPAFKDQKNIFQTQKITDFSNFNMSCMHKKKNILGQEWILT